jgi:hypothetical protein
VGAGLRFLVYWLGATLTGYMLVALPLIVLLNLSSAASFLLGMVVGGVSPLIGLQSRRVSDWVGL